MSPSLSHLHGFFENPINASHRARKFLHQNYNHSEFPRYPVKYRGWRVISKIGNQKRKNKQIHVQKFESIKEK